MNSPFFICRHCGNIVAMIRDCGVPVKCCGESMKVLEEAEQSGSQDKHRPLYTVNEGVVTVSVGQEQHPMLADHAIEWVAVETERGLQFTRLQPGDLPQAVFTVAENDDVIAVYAFCNQHGLWKQEKR